MFDPPIRVVARARRFEFVPPNLFGSLLVSQGSAKYAKGWATAVHIQNNTHLETHEALHVILRHKH